MWTSEDSDITMQECKSILKAAFEQAEDDTWVANTLIQLCKNMVAEMNQIPCDTCEFKYDHAQRRVVLTCRLHPAHHLGGWWAAMSSTTKEENNVE